MPKLLIILFASVWAHSGVAFEPFIPLDPFPPIPESNLQSPEKINLGKTLFFDKALSKSLRLSCNDCHNLMSGGDSNGVQYAKVKTGGYYRDPPTLWNVGYQTIFFWDGRALNLEAAIHEHILDDSIMAMLDAGNVENRLKQRKGYEDLFKLAFPGQNAINYENTVKALASFLRNLKTQGGKFDRYLKGDERAITSRAKSGFKEFVEIGCASCHFWMSLAGPVPGLAFKTGQGFYELFPNHLGTKYDEKYGLAEDLGRFHVTDKEHHKRLWRVPTLRNIELTAPYFHNGAVSDLGEAIEIMAETQLKLKLTPLQIDNIHEFLKTLTGEFETYTMPYIPERLEK